eukprot:SAG22_NODE_200_length_15420_cov_4.424581_11_plen_585_part_00
MMGGLLVGLLLQATGRAAPPLQATGRAAPPLQDTLYDTERVLVPVSLVPAELPELLAQHRHIRLESANYCAACPTDPCGRAECGWNISVASGMSVQGLPGTQVPSVVVEPGSSGVLLSNLNFCQSAQSLLLFPPALPGSPPTRESSFIRLHGVHVLFDGAAAEDLLFVDLGWLSAPKPPAGTKLFTVGGVHFGPGASVVNSRFIRSVVQAPWPTVTADLGGPEPSEFRGNAFLFQNSNCETTQASFLIDGAEELTIVGNDNEAYNAARLESTVQVRRSGDVRLAGLAGVLKCHNAGHPPGPDFGIFDMDADSILTLVPSVIRILYTHGHGASANETPAAALPELTLGPSVASFTQLGGNNYSHSDKHSTPTLRLLDTAMTGLRVGGLSAPPTPPASLSAAEAAALSKQVTTAERPGTAWALPTFGASDRWLEAAAAAATRSASMTEPRDDAPMIQTLIDSTPNKTAILPPGVYHIGTPLKLGSHGHADGPTGRGYLIGAGPDKTFIFALNASMSMVVADLPDGEGYANRSSYHFHVGGLTLAGGRYGIHWTAGQQMAHIQIGQSVLSHVLLANFTGAGIFADDV